MKYSPILLSAFLLLAPLSVRAEEMPLSSDYTGDCIIRDFQSTFDLKSDASLSVSEDISVDCGTLVGKHGIFRILPTRAPRPKGEYPATPVSLQSITDFEGNPLKFQTINSVIDHTVTWKIGDPDQSIKGLHYYRIRYSVQNAVEATSEGQRLYWNLNGNFWQLPIEHFKATVNFPTNMVTTTALTSGPLGSTDNALAETGAYDEKHFEVLSRQTLQPGDGITVVTKLPAGAVSLYEPSFWQLYQDQLWFLWPLLVLIGCFILWRKLGKDPLKGRAIAVEYAPPTGLLPLEMGVVDKAGSVQKEFITATIIDFAVRGYLTITEQDNSKALGLLHSKDWVLTRTKKPISDLKEYEKTVMGALFYGASEAGTTIQLSALRPSLSTITVSLQKQVMAELDAKNIFDKKSRSLAGWMAVVAVLITGLLIWLSFNYLGLYAAGAAVLAGIIALIFAALMPRRTPEGALLECSIRGFKMYLAKAEKYKMPYYEKENIFEKYLPYAIAFSLTGKWIAAMKSLYGDNYTNMLPAWYLMNGGVGSFDSFATNLNTLSSQISAATAPASSGGSGGGFSGGGGGGGGGGSW